MEYQQNLIRYKQLKDNMPDNNLVQVCVGRYEINLNKYIETGQDKYLLIMKAIGNILEQFLDVEFNQRLKRSCTERAKRGSSYTGIYMSQGILQEK